MERLVTDEIFNAKEDISSGDLMLAEKDFCDLLQTFITSKEYLKVEEALFDLFYKLEREYFHAGFMDGIRFLMRICNNGQPEIHN